MCVCGPRTLLLSDGGSFEYVKMASVDVRRERERERERGAESFKLGGLRMGLVGRKMSSKPLCAIAPCEPILK